MMSTVAPSQNVYAPTGMVATVDGLATSAGVEALRRGGSAVDAAIAANAVLTVTLPNQCGLGGDLFALVHSPGTPPAVLESAGRAGSGVDAEAMRGKGLDAVPPDHIASITIPGCVDGWVALHREYGRLALPEVLAAAIDYAQEGFSVSPFLARTISGRAALAAHIEGADGEIQPGRRLRRPETARILTDVAKGGRDAFYEGAFGRALQEVGSGLFTDTDLRTPQAMWASPLSADVFGARVWTTQPPTSGYLTLGSAWLADRLDLPEDPDEGVWAHLLIEAMRQAAFDRSDVLFDGAHGQEMLAPERLGPRLAAIHRERTAELQDSYRLGGTTYLTAVDKDRTAVSLIQSNCRSFGSGFVAPGTGIWLHNRGTGFSLRSQHPNELRPGRRPAHTLSPAVVTDGANRLRACLGTRGGDSQPQVVLQLLARLLRAGQTPADALAAGRWILRGAHDDTSFNTWRSRGRVRACLEGNVAPEWAPFLRAAGHHTEVEDAFSHSFGHANIVMTDAEGLIGAADPRSGSATAAGY